MEEILGSYSILHLIQLGLWDNLQRLLDTFVIFQLKATFCLPIIGVKKNPQSPMYTQLGVITKGTVVEVRIVKVLS